MEQLTHADTLNGSALTPVQLARTEFEQLLAKREGRRAIVYRDPRGRLTVGIGHLVRLADDLEFGDRISNERINEFFRHDTAAAFEAAQQQMAEAGIHDHRFLPYLASVCFQLGIHWIHIWEHTWDLICAGLYERAAQAVQHTPWARETPTRVLDFVNALRRLEKKP